MRASFLTICLTVTFFAAAGCANGHEGTPELIPGPPGEDGVDGADGAPGADGEDGAPGPAGPDGATGADGADGADGVHCWDLSEDTICDAAEDVDGSGACDVLDCQGPAGAAGAPGADGLDGVNGVDGEDGVHCWDLSGDGACSPAEDVDGSGGCDVADCRGADGAAGVAGADGAQGADGVHCWDLSGDGVCGPAEDVDGSGSCDVSDCRGADGVGDTYDGGDFALSNQSCGAGSYVEGIAADGTLLCASDLDTTYSAGEGLILTGQTFRVDTVVTVTRTYGGLGGLGTEAFGDFGTAASSGAIDVTVFNRDDVPDTMYAYRCMKVNLSVVACADMLSGISVDHLTFSPAEKVMFSTADFDIVTYLDGGSPFGAEVIVRNTSGTNNLFYDITGGL